jgi:hypothetical protein
MTITMRMTSALRVGGGPATSDQPPATRGRTRPPVLASSVPTLFE